MLLNNPFPPLPTFMRSLDFFTNDIKLKKINEIQVILVSEWKTIFNKKE